MNPDRVPDPVTVWAVRLDVSIEDFEGTLSLVPDALIFDEGSGGVRIPLRSIHRVKRLRASPVLMVTQAAEEGGGRFAFYFVRPPSSTPAEGVSKRKNKRKTILHLQAKGRSLKDVLVEWESAVDLACRATQQEPG